jgi:hypothetical protein
MSSVDTSDIKHNNIIKQKEEHTTHHKHINDELSSLLPDPPESEIIKPQVFFLP